jgi:hypothetical protein
MAGWPTTMRQIGRGDVMVRVAVAWRGRGGGSRTCAGLCIACLAGPRLSGSAVAGCPAWPGLGAATW